MRSPANKWRRRIKGQPANPGSPGKMAVKTVCVWLKALEKLENMQCLEVTKTRQALK